MPVVSTPRALPIEWAVAGRPIASELESGDLHVVEPFDGGVLVGVIDGLGHGPAAARAAREAAALIGALAGEPLSAIVRRCHAETRGSRGVVLSLASLSLSPPELSFTGIGNVDGLLLRTIDGAITQKLLTSRGGVVGGDMPSPRIETLPLVSGDVLLLTTDGIRRGFAAELELLSSVAELSAVVCQRYARPTDDALVLAVRWLPP